MLIELVDDLRCPQPHEPTWLVASADIVQGRHIVEGVLGCPLCHREYAIRRGAVWFAEPPHPPTEPEGIDAEQAVRLAALLDLSEAQGFGVLTGQWGRAATFLAPIVPCHLVVLNPPALERDTEGISVVYATSIPLAAESCRGIAVDASHASTMLADAVNALKPSGRLVAPASAPLPAGVGELTRDATVWVAERAAPPPTLVPLRPASR